MYPQVLKNGEEQPTVSVPTQQDMESMTEYVAEWVAVRHNSWGDMNRYLLSSAKESTAEQRKDSTKSNMASQWVLLGFLAGVGVRGYWQE